MAGYVAFPWNATTWTATGSSTTATWNQWITTGTAYTTTAITTDVWTTWNEWHQPVMQQFQFDEEEMQRRRDEAQRRREDESRRRLEEMERLRGAQDRAMILLAEVVDPDHWVLDELIQLEGSDGRLYRIELHRNTVHGNIVRVDEHGCVLGRACVAPRMWEGNMAIPVADGWTGQYLGLRFDAEEFLSHANWSETYRGCQNPDQVAAVVPIAA